MNVVGFEHGSRLIIPVLWRQSAFDSLLAIPENLGVVSLHSKWPFVGCGCGRDKLNSTSIYGHFELFYPRHKQITLVEGLVKADSVRLTQETIEFLDKSRKVVRQFSKLQVKAYPVFADGDDPMVVSAPS
jgi:hypothetical protein